MPDTITESEWRRITEFANTPGHEQDPEQLVPDDDSE